MGAELLLNTNMVMGQEKKMELIQGADTCLGKYQRRWTEITIENTILRAISWRQDENKIQCYICCSRAYLPQNCV